MRSWLPYLKKTVDLAGGTARSVARTARRIFVVQLPKTPDRTFSISGDLFLRGLGLVLLAAFLTAETQVLGLIGTKGILPLAESLKGVAAEYGVKRYFYLPTLFWFKAGDAVLTGSCWLGVAVSLLLVLGIAPLPCLLTAWALYLSLVTAGADFFNYQWDLLLLEICFAALFMAPAWRLNPGNRRDIPVVFRWLLLWLLFRVVFFSGLIKLLSGDPDWGTLSALRFFFQCQPLPTPLAWWAQQTPEPLLKAVCLVVLLVELGVPFLMLLNRRLRIASFFILVAYQFVLMATVNTNFFNLLVILLCLLLLDDASWLSASRLRGILSPFARSKANPSPPMTRRLLPYFIFIAVLSVIQTSADLGYKGKWPEPFLSLFRLNVPLRFTSHYGYTISSADTRPVIVVEGTSDGKEWKEYGFRWKPGDSKRMPGFAAPHQPRLDAQMWLAVFGKCEDAPWFQQFMGRLASASKPVLGLLSSDPFHGVPPASVRARLYDYRFTTFAEWRRTGDWWRRVDRGEFCPPVSKPD